MTVLNPPPPPATLTPPTVLLLGASFELIEQAGSWPVSGNPPASTTNLSGPDGFMQWANWLNGGGLRVVLNAAQAGLTSTQQLANIINPLNAQYALGLSPAPGFVYLGHITGDDPGTLSTAQSIANDLTAYKLFRSAYPDAVIILPTLPGVNIPAGTGNAALRNALNPQRRQLAASQPNTVQWDQEAAFTNPLTGLPVVAWSPDQTHPNPLGGFNVGQGLGKILAPYQLGGGGVGYVNDYSNDSRVSGANGGWTTDAMFTGAGPSGAGWAFTGPAAAAQSLVARTDQYGNWQKLTLGGTAGQMRMRHLLTSLPVGAIFYVEGQVQLNGDIAGGAITDLSILLTVANNVFATIGTTGVFGDQQGNRGNYPNLPAGTILYGRSPPLIIPTGAIAGNSALDCAVNGTMTAGSVQFSRVSLVRIG